VSLNRSSAQKNNYDKLWLLFYSLWRQHYNSIYGVSVLEDDFVNSFSYLIILFGCLTSVDGEEERIEMSVLLPRTSLGLHSVVLQRRMT
jgi:hypothetical protein